MYEFSSSCSPSLKVPAVPIVSPQSPSTLTGHLRDSIWFQGLRLCLCKQAPGTPDKNPPTHLWKPLPSSWAAYRPDTCCRISLDTSVRAHTHTHSCTPRIGSSKQEKLGINRASCRRGVRFCAVAWEVARLLQALPHPHPTPSSRPAAGRSSLSLSSICHHILQLFIRCLPCTMLCGRGEGSMVSRAKPWSSVHSSMKWGITWMVQGPLQAAPILSSRITP